MLSLQQCQNICLAGRRDHKTCRYLYQDDLDMKKWHCAKLLPAKRDKIDEAVQDYLSECSRRSKDPKQKAVPLGDNCSGFPILKHVLQGYDQ